MISRPIRSLLIANRGEIAVRINRACHLLMQTDHYVTDICYQVGFNNVANFNRRFLEIKGMTPSEFSAACRPAVPSL